MTYFVSNLEYEIMKASLTDIIFSIWVREFLSTIPLSSVVSCPFPLYATDLVVYTVME